MSKKSYSKKSKTNYKKKNVDKEKMNEIFMSPLLVFYFITLVHFFSIYPLVINSKRD